MTRIPKTVVLTGAVLLALVWLGLVVPSGGRAADPEGPGVDEREVEAVTKVKEKYKRSLLKVPGTVGVGVGLTERGDRIAIHVYVLKWADKSRLPKTLDGVPVQVIETEGFRCRIAAEVRGFEPRDFMSPKAAVTRGRFSLFGVAAARMAYEDAGLASLGRRSRVAVCFGNSAIAISEVQNGIEQFSRHGTTTVSPSIALEAASHAVTGHISADLSLKGQTMTLATACSTGIDVVQWAFQQIRSRFSDDVEARIAYSRAASGSPSPSAMSWQARRAATMRLPIMPLGP